MNAFVDGVKHNTVHRTAGLFVVTASNRHCDLDQLQQGFR